MTDWAGAEIFIVLPGGIVSIQTRHKEEQDSTHDWYNLVNGSCDGWVKLASGYNPPRDVSILIAWPCTPVIKSVTEDSGKRSRQNKPWQ